MIDKVERAAKEAMAAAPGKMAKFWRAVAVTAGTPGHIPDETRELYPWRRTHASMAAHLVAGQSNTTSL